MENFLETVPWKRVPAADRAVWLDRDVEEVRGAAVSWKTGGCEDAGLDLRGGAKTSSSAAWMKS